MRRFDVRLPNTVSPHSDRIVHTLSRRSLRRVMFHITALINPRQRTVSSVARHTVTRLHATAAPPPPAAALLTLIRVHNHRFIGRRYRPLSDRASARTPAFRYRLPLIANAPFISCHGVIRIGATTLHRARCSSHYNCSNTHRFNHSGYYHCPARRPSTVARSHHTVTFQPFRCRIADRSIRSQRKRSLHNATRNAAHSPAWNRSLPAGASRSAAYPATVQNQLARSFQFTGTYKSLKKSNRQSLQRGRRSPRPAMETITAIASSPIRLYGRIGVIAFAPVTTYNKKKKKKTYACSRRRQNTHARRARRRAALRSAGIADRRQPLHKTKKTQYTRIAPRVTVTVAVCG